MPSESSTIFGGPSSNLHKPSWSCTRAVYFLSCYTAQSTGGWLPVSLTSSPFFTQNPGWILRIFWPNNIPKEQLLARCRQDWMETIIMRRRWRRTGHVLNRKEPGNITSTALHWQSPTLGARLLHWITEGKRKRGRPKNTWRWTEEEEMKTLDHTWGTIAKLAQNR